MLRLSKLTDYGIVVMTQLAADPDRLHAATEVAGATGIGTATVSKLLKSLARAGLVTSVRGARGGYRLARGAETISVAELVDALEGPVALTECSSDEGSCEQEPHCAVRVNFQRINEAIRGALAEVTLAEMVAPPGSRYVNFSPRLRAS